MFLTYLTLKIAHATDGQQAHTLSHPGLSSGGKELQKPITSVFFSGSHGSHGSHVWLAGSLARTLATLAADMKFVIYIFLTYSSVVLHALKKCEKVNVCKCETDEGVIDLSSLAGAGSNIPRFKNIVDKLDELENKISWNPCNKWTEIPPQSQAKSNCDNIAVCYNFKNLEYCGIGKQETADYSYNETSGTCVLTLTGKPFQGQGPQSTSTHIFLQCDAHEEGRVESLERTLSTSDDFKVFMKLHTKYACVKSGLSVGSIIIIIFISLLLVYLVAGILFNKYSKGASGKELFPNVNFWIDFPLLVKDGAVFSFECCKKVCSRKRSSYESI